MLTNFLKVLFRRLRLIKIDRNFLVFLIFLAISIVFWFMQTIQETTEVTIAYKLKIDELPKDVVYTSNVPDEVQVSFSSKGWNAFYYKFMKNDTHELSIPFKEVNQKSGKIVIDAILNGSINKAVASPPLQAATNVASSSTLTLLTSMPPSTYTAASTASRRRISPSTISKTLSTHVSPFWCPKEPKPSPTPSKLRYAWTSSPTRRCKFQSTVRMCPTAKSYAPSHSKSRLPFWSVPLSTTTSQPTIFCWWWITTTPSQAPTDANCTSVNVLKTYATCASTLNLSNTS